MSASRLATATSQVLAERLEFGQSSARRLAVGVHGIVETMVDVIVDQLALGIADRGLDRVQLLGKLQAGPAVLDHANQGAQMTLGTLQALDDVRMACVLNGHILSPWRG